MLKDYRGRTSKCTRYAPLRTLRDELLKMFPRGGDVELGERCGDVSVVGHDDHDVGVAGENVNVGRERRVLHLHTQKLGLSLGAAQFKLLYYIGCALEAVAVVLLSPTDTTRRHGDKHRSKITSKINNFPYLSLVICEMTRKVALSNKTISSAPQMELNSSNCDSRTCTLGIRLYTICDQALYRVSSQIEVAKHFILKLQTNTDIYIRIFIESCAGKM
jgi:hypothetical protein